MKSANDAGGKNQQELKRFLEMMRTLSDHINDDDTVAIHPIFYN